jgi:uncharacterized iron-regulated protein
MRFDRSRPFRLCSLVVLAAALGPAGCAAGPAPPAAPGPDPGAYRIHDARTGEPVPLARLVDRVAESRVLLFGEQHDDAVAHRLQLAILQGLAERGIPVVLGLESFERDVQGTLDAYLAGRVPEEELLRTARPWPNYAAAHRPLVELARREGWPVLASNLPRPLAARVSRGGLAALRDLPPAERARAAAQVDCPRDAYFERFAAEMRRSASAHGGHPGTMDDAMVERFYEAQCLKDETMAESIHRALADPATRLVVHVHGAFHSDYRLGLVPRVERRAPAVPVLTLSALAVPDPATADPVGHRDRADFVVFTRAAPRAP